MPRVSPGFVEIREVYVHPLFLRCLLENDYVLHPFWVVHFTDEADFTELLDLFFHG